MSPLSQRALDRPFLRRPPLARGQATQIPFPRARPGGLVPRKVFAPTAPAFGGQGPAPAGSVSGDAFRASAVVRLALCKTLGGLCQTSFRGAAAGVELPLQ